MDKAARDELLTCMVRHKGFGGLFGVDVTIWLRLLDLFADFDTLEKTHERRVKHGHDQVAKRIMLEAKLAEAETRRGRSN